MEYRHILCSVDGSELSEMGLKHAAYLSKTTGAKLSIIHVVEKWYRAADVVTTSPEWQKIHEDWLNKGREVLEAAARKARDGGGAHIQTVLKEGDAAYEIVAMATEHRMDVIVMATHRYSSVGKLFAGSVTDKVSRKAPCPVLWVFK
ncbi:MAG: universal stress protein [Deltaproteobacteria bacterium]|nr:universal stress protein [Deltaproteobacteria bacterium]